MSVSFGGMGEMFATFKTDGTAEAGKAVQMQDNDTVAVCGAGGKFIGIAADTAGDGYATVQLKGYTEMAYAGTAPTVGFCSLAGAAEGVAVSENGREYLVVRVDTANKTVGFIM